MVEIDGFPAVVVHGAGRIGLWPSDDPVAQVALECDSATVQACVGIGDVEWRCFELCRGVGFHAGGVAPLDLAASVLKLFGDHTVPA